MDWFLKLLGLVARPQGSASHPSGGFGTPAEAIADLIHRHRAANDDGWVHLEATVPGRTITIQLQRDQLNTLLDELPPHAAEVLGFERLEAGLYRVSDSSPENLAATIDALFVEHYRLGPGYTLAGRLDG